MRRMIATFEPDLIPISKEPLSIGDRFRANVAQYMRDQNLSQAALAARIEAVREKKVYRERVADMLSGDHEPTLGWVEMTARALGVTVHDILDEKDY